MGKLGEVRDVSIDLLIPYAKNAKVHSELQVEKIANSIEEFGFLNPCLIDKDYNIIAGHGRVLAAKQLGMKEIPCIFVEGLTESQRKAYILADNKLTELGEWDMNIVIDELEELKLDGFDIELTGFEEKTQYDLPIDQDHLGGITPLEHTLKIDGTVIGMTDEEYDLIKDKLNEYTEMNGAGFGFVRWLLDD